MMFLGCFSGFPRVSEFISTVIVIKQPSVSRVTESKVAEKLMNGSTQLTFLVTSLSLMVEAFFVEDIIIFRTGRKILGV